MKLKCKTGFTVEDNCLTYYGHTIMPKILKVMIFEISHDSHIAGYHDTHKIFEVLSHLFWLPTCQRDYNAYAESCNTCARVNDTS